MTISSISAAGLGEYVLASSNSSQLQQAFQALQSNLISGNLSGAQSSFQSVQSLYQNSLSASGGASSSSQLSNDLAAVGSALSSGDLSTAQSAFTAVQNDLKSTAWPSQVTEANTASQSVAFVDQLLSTLDSNASSSPTDVSSTLLQNYYNSGFNVHG